MCGREQQPTSLVIYCLTVGGRWLDARMLRARPPCGGGGGRRARRVRSTHASDTASGGAGRDSRRRGRTATVTSVTGRRAASAAGPLGVLRRLRRWGKIDLTRPKCRCCVLATLGLNIGNILACCRDENSLNIADILTCHGWRRPARSGVKLQVPKSVDFGLKLGQISRICRISSWNGLQFHGNLISHCVLRVFVVRRCAESRGTGLAMRD